MKYVVMRVQLASDTALELPIIFPDLLVHSMVAELFTKHMAEVYKDKTCTVVSAGEISCTSIDFPACHGESSSLNMVSRQDKDDELLAMADYGGLFK